MEQEKLELERLDRIVSRSLHKMHEYEFRLRENPTVKDALTLAFGYAVHFDRYMKFNEYRVRKYYLISSSV